MFKLSSATKRITAVGLLVCAVILGSAFPHAAEANSMLGSSRSFAVLAGSTVTNTGDSVVTGNLGVWPGTAVTGFPPGIVNGTQHIADGVAQQAQADVTTAYNTLAGLPCDFNLTDQDLGGQTLIPGVYCFSTSAQLTGTVTLDSQGDPDALFIFQIGSTLTTATNSAVAMDGGTSCNVLWQVGSSATLGTTTSFIGNIVALTSITLNNGAIINGRALARNGAVTMDNNRVSNAECITVDVPTATPTATTELPTATATGTTEAPTATSTGTSEEPTATSTDVPGAPTATTGPGTTVPGTSTPSIPGPGDGTPAVTPPVETPGPGTPTSTIASATPGITDEETPVVVTGTPTVETGTGTPGTSTPITGTPATGTPATATPSITTQSTPSVTISTSTPTATATATSTSVTVWFPNTGSGGAVAAQQSQSVTTTSLAISIALVLLLTGGLAFAVERRSRR